MGCYIPIPVESTRDAVEEGIEGGEGRDGREGEAATGVLQ